MPPRRLVNRLPPCPRLPLKDRIGLSLEKLELAPHLLSGNSRSALPRKEITAPKLFE
jgi:hypothetical protein